MKIAIEEAKKAHDKGEVPIGAVITDSKGKIISKSGNRNIELYDPTAHAEMLVIKQACQTLGVQRLVNCYIYVTLEPCPMCAAAISFARISRLYFGAYDCRFGAVENGIRLYSSNQINFIPDVYGGIEEEICKSTIKDFFYQIRILNNKKI